MFKKLCLVLLCGLLSFSIFGCSNITLQTVQGKNGNIVSSLTFDASDLSTSEKQTVYNFTREYCDQLIDAYKDNIITLFSNIYDFEELGINDDNAKMSHIILEHQNFNLLAGDIEFSKTYAEFTTADDATLTVSIGFVSVYAYMMFFCPNAFAYNELSNTVKFDGAKYAMLIDVPVTPSDYQKDENLFMTTHLQTCVPFSYNGEEPALLQSYTTSTKTHPVGTTLVDAICEELGENAENAKFLFDFVTPFSRLHSNATQYQDGANYHHIFDLGSNINAEVIIWRTYSNYAPWYVVALCLGLLLVGATFLVLFINKKVKTKKSLETLNKIDVFMTKKNMGENENEQEKN